MKTISKDSFPQEGNAITEVLENILKAYATPSFGSISKRETDILLFSSLQDLGIIDKNPEIYDVVQLLHITRAKARNLIYESALRRQEVEEMNHALEEELKRVIVKPTFLRDGDKICIEIDNLLLIDYIRHKLKVLKHITDGSYHAEVVKMTLDAFTDLYESLLPKESLKEINEKFVALGLKPDNSAKTLVKNVLMSMCKVVLGKAGEQLAGTFITILGDWMSSKFDNIPVDKNELEGTIYGELNFA